MKRERREMGLGNCTGRVNLHGLWVGYRQVGVGVDFLLPAQNPYPICGFHRYWGIGWAWIG
jgi:hypothetical protein